MKIKTEIELSPQEMRELLGMDKFEFDPTQIVQKTLEDSLAKMTPQTLMQQWFNMYGTGKEV